MCGLYKCGAAGKGGKNTRIGFLQLQLFEFLKMLSNPFQQLTALTVDACSNESVKAHRVTFLKLQVETYLLSRQTNFRVFLKCLMCLEPKYFSKQYHVVERERNKGCFSS